MTDLAHLHDALVSEVGCLYWAEKQVSSVVGRAIAQPHTAPSPPLFSVVQTSTMRRWRLEQVFRLLDEEIVNRRCPRMTAILEKRVPPAELLQRASGHLSALYSTAAARARALGFVDVACLLDQCLDDAHAVQASTALPASPAVSGPPAPASAPDASPTS